jgi:hypothetical protein
LCSEAHELAYFALIDCSCAMALGVPQQLEYDTTIYPWSSSSSLHQWVHGSPTEFQLVLADINACRDKSPNARDWKDIEHWLLAWQSRSGEHVFTESWMTVAWYAVQESWRLALLVYLYLVSHVFWSSRFLLASDAHRDRPSAMFLPIIRKYSHISNKYSRWSEQ